MSENYLTSDDRREKICVIYNEDCLGLSIFNAFLAKHATDKSFKKINLICYENPPNYYLPKNSSEKITQYNYFSDPLNWNNASGPKTDLSVFLSDAVDLSETVFFIDSLSCLITYHKFYTVYRNLSCLNKSAGKIIALLHSDLLTLKKVEELESLPRTIVELHQCIYTKGVLEKTVIVTHKKPNGKASKQVEIVSIDKDLNINCRKKVYESSLKDETDVMETIQSLSTFKLGFDLSENEKKARDELVLPYMRAQAGLGGGKIIYQAEADELEEDPDDDLEI